MSIPVINNSDNPIDREQSVNNLVESVALMETGLSHIINAEGEKIQKVIKYDSDEDVPLEDILKVNDSAQKMINNISKLEMILQNKLETSKKLNDSGLIPGPPGEDGLTPYIGPNGNWWIGEVDTGVPAQGPQGETGDQGIPGAEGLPGNDGITPRIGPNGNWWIGEVDTGVPAQGPTGDQGIPGEKAEVFSQYAFASNQTETVLEVSELIPFPDTHLSSYIDINEEGTTFTTGRGTYLISYQLNFREPTNNIIHLEINGVPYIPATTGGIPNQMSTTYNSTVLVTFTVITTISLSLWGDDNPVAIPMQGGNAISIVKVSA